MVYKTGRKNMKDRFESLELQNVKEQIAQHCCFSREKRKYDNFPHVLKNCGSSVNCKEQRKPMIY